MSTRKLYQIIASHLNAMENCRDTGDDEWLVKHTEMVRQLTDDYLPSGSGFDNGTRIDMEASKGGERLVFTTAYHHMNESGMYDGWTEHTVTIRPCLIHGMSMKVTGRDRNDIKDYIAECFSSALEQEFESDHTSGSYKLAA